MASSTAAAPIALSTNSSTDWQLASQRARDRIIRLQEQRAQEASPRTRVGTFLAGTDGTKPAFRVGQLDTELLDEELLDLLKGQLWAGLKYFRPTLKESYEPELLLLLRAALFKLTIWDHNATYGAALQNLRYTDARKSGPIDHPPTKVQKSLYGLLTVGGRYFQSRLNLFLLSRSNPEDSTPFTAKLSRLIDSVSTLHSVLTIVSFTAFLVTGHYRTIIDRVLRMRLVSPNRVVAREVSFEYLNRQLVWHAFTEFLLFILPVLRVGRWRRWWARLLRKIRGDGAGGADSSGELSFLPERTCAVCYKETDVTSELGATGEKATDVTNPYEAVECGHVYCYVCIAGKIELEEGEGWTCLRCGALVKRCRPWRGGLQGLTGVGEWGEEILERRVGFESEYGEESAGFLDEMQDGDVEDETDEETDHEGDESGTEVASELTERPADDDYYTSSGIRWTDDTEDAGFDDSVYNTAEGEDDYED